MVDISKPQDVFSKTRAILIVTGDHARSKEHAQRQRDELESLCNTIGIQVGAWLFFPIREFNSATYIGSGQVERLAFTAQENECSLVVFNNGISARIQRNLEQALDLCVVDRQEIILQIFAERATTREARLQVELAQLQYSLPRLRRRWTNLSQQRGGVKGAKGSGEKQLELDRRRAQERITRLKREIKEISKQRNVQRRNRLQKNIPNVAIVGYTNSGKSTFLNRVADSNVLSKDMLFATLDPTTRKVRLPNGETVLLTDTVGFVSDLPHELVDAFKSTLEEASLANALVIVLDASREDLLQCWETTTQVLESLGALEKPHLTLLNKMDLVTDENLFAVNSFMAEEPSSMKVSILGDDSMEDVLERIGLLVSKSQNTMEDAT